MAKMAASLRLGFRRFVVRNNLRSVAALYSSVRSYAVADKMTHTGQVVQGCKEISGTYEQYTCLLRNLSFKNRSPVLLINITLIVLYYVLMNLQQWDSNDYRLARFTDRQKEVS